MYERSCKGIAKLIARKRVHPSSPARERCRRHRCERDLTSLVCTRARAREGGGGTEGENTWGRRRARFESGDASMRKGDFRRCENFSSARARAREHGKTVQYFPGGNRQVFSGGMAHPSP